VLAVTVTGFVVVHRIRLEREPAGLT